MKYLIILLIPIYIVQHSMRGKPYNDTLSVGWVTISKDTVSSVEYRPNTVRVTKNGKRKTFSRRFFTICEEKKK